MPDDPLDVLKQEALQAAVAPAPPAPAVPGASVGAPAPPPSRFRLFMGGLWRKLTSPTSRKPEEFRERRIARYVNSNLDGRGHVEGPAHRALLGESCSLAFEALISRDGNAQTPLGHLMASGGEYVWILWDEAPQRNAPEPPPPSMPPAAAVVEAPAPKAPRRRARGRRKGAA